MVNSQESVDGDTQTLLVENEVVAPTAKPRTAPIQHTSDIRKLNVRLFFATD